jgi:cell division protein FtsQ
MPLSQLQSAHVPVASGYITESLEMGDTIQTHVMKGLLKIATYVDKDAFWNAQIEQIFVNEEAEFVLSPKLGNHIVYFGDTQNMAKKFDNLHVFYREALSRIGWSKYRKIDVRFENQIVAKK